MLLNFGERWIFLATLVLGTTRVCKTRVAELGQQQWVYSKKHLQMRTLIAGMQSEILAPIWFAG